AGNYARRVFLPALRDAGARAHAICAPDGVRAAQLAEAFDVPVITSDPDDVFADPSIGVVALLTRHDAHARLAVAAMRAGKDVYGEKPLALTLEELQEVERVHAATGRRLMVGFNRRFAPTTSALRERLARHDAPAVMTMTVNAGALEPTHWTRQPDQGGRIVGEAVHMVDLMRHLAMSPIVSLDITEMLEPYEDNAVLTMRFASGALASIQYTSMGHTGVPKERLEVFVEGCVYQLDNFRTLRAHDDQPASVLPDWLWRSTTTQDKGHAAMVAQWWSAMRGGDPAPIAAAELFEVAGALLSARGVGV
ncbi:MAG: Gfo/Idh/MocA family oxidoreductase, partial [Myxococcota bacterium]